jgi:hypothetical protein
VPPLLWRLGQVRRITDIIACDIQPLQNLKVLVKAAEKEESKEAKDAAKTAWAAYGPAMCCICIHSAPCCAFGSVRLPSHASLRCMCVHERVCVCVVGACACA